MSSKDVVISVKNLSKHFEIYDRPADRLKQFLLPRIQRLLGIMPRKYFREFCALDGVSFEVMRGETVGIIGRNGSGKSTLLQMICGTLTPTVGSIQTNGRIAALLELGSGFNPEFTGRENVFLNASVLGLNNEEIDERFDQIVAFADIGDFIDQPVKTYSSGMMVRLAFAVIAHVDADILVIDEALSVGDAFFTQKCMRFIRDFQSKNGTILFVSHDIASVTNICKRALLVYPNNKYPAQIDSAEKVCEKYLSELYDSTERVSYVEKIRDVQNIEKINKEIQQITFDSKVPQENKYHISTFNINSDSFGVGGAKIIDAGFCDESGNSIAQVRGGSHVSFFVSVIFNQNIFSPAVGIIIKDRLGQYVFTEGTDAYFREHLSIVEEGSGMIVRFDFLMPILHKGVYTINLAVAEGIGDDHIQHHWIHDALKIEALTSPVVHGIAGLINSKIKVTLNSFGKK